MSVASWLSEVAEAVAQCEPENVHATLRALSLWGRVRLWDLLHYGGQFFSKEEASTVREVGECIMASADSLAPKACEGGSSRWVLRPKHHTLQEILNERCTTCRNPFMVVVFFG
jgi:hypothetical protein